MTINEARQAMLDFVNSRKGETVSLDLLGESDKMIFVMVKTFMFASFLPTKERIMRAINNAEAHSESGFDKFSDRILYVAKE